MSAQDLHGVRRLERSGSTWGNQYAAVTADEALDLRSRLGLNTIHYTANSGDRH